jgi:uncharacterized membrane protein YgaE (UPF0421/DUF939 family)
MVAEIHASWKATALTALWRGVSASIVATFCYVTASRVPSLHEPYWAPIAAVVVLYSQTDATRKASRDRFIGTAIGCVIGYESAIFWHGSVLLYGVAVFVAVGLCYLLRLENAARLCAVAVSVITLIPRSEPASVIAFHRFVEVSYGVACAVVYTVLLDGARRRWRSRT